MARRAPTPRNLNVGDVLCSSWGYEQTNVDWYIVDSLVGKASVKIQKVGSKRDYDNPTGMAGKCFPDINNKIGEPFTKRAQGDCVKIESYARAYKVDPSQGKFFSEWY